MRGLAVTHGESSANLHFGVVSKVDGARPQIKVYFEDLEMESHWLHVPQDGTLKNKHYKMQYRKGDQVAVLLDPLGEEGVVLGAIYSEADPPPVTDPAKWHKTFEDGTVIEYDSNLHELKADIKGKADIKADGPVTLEAQLVTIKASVIELDGLVVKTPSMLVAGLINFVPPPPPAP